MGMFRPSEQRLERVASWFEGEYPTLLRFAYFVSGDPAGAQDLVQDAFVRLYRAAARIDEATIGAYARTTITNLARSRFRRIATERSGHPGARTASHPPDVEARDEVWRAVLALSPRQRAVVALRFYEDMSERDIATTLGLSAGAVKKHNDRAMQKLRAILGRES